MKLQQFWLRDKDPQSLPFAQRIDRRALIALVQKGLKYHQIEQVHSKVSFVEKSPMPTFSASVDRR